MEGYSCVCALTLEDVITQASRQAFQLVLLSSGLDETAEKQVRTALQQLQPHVPIVQHYGGGSGLLYNEIAEALHQQPKP